MAAHGELACVFLLTALYWNSYILSAHSLESFAEAQWPNHGGGIANRREARLEHKISPHTVAKLKKKWSVATAGAVTVTPAIANGVIYFPTWEGEVYAVKEHDGSLVWRRNLTDVVGSKTALLSRHTPVVEKEYLLVGAYTPALQVALDIRTGELIWSKLVDSNPYACITMSGTVYKSAYYIGVSSQSETLGGEPCCSFQGSMLKMDIKTGDIKWQTKMLPDNNGKVGLYSGASIWGSSPSIDPKRNLVYIATGNLYSSPPNVTSCEEIQTNKTIRDVPDPCINPNDHSESILALNLDTGRIGWTHKLGGYDTWVYACAVGSIIAPTSPNCPAIVGPDSDFGEAPMMLTIRRPTNYTSSGSNKKFEDEWLDIVVTGQKSGIVWALDRDNGTLVWDAVTGPGGALGGSMWGAATDGERVITNVVNYGHQNFTLLPSNVVTTSGGWVAMNASSGDILWSIAAPNASPPIGPISVANHVVLASASFGAPNGTMYALDTKSGKVLWQYEVNASINGGVSINKECIYFGEGSRNGVDNTPASNTFGHAIDAICIT